MSTGFIPGLAADVIRHSTKNKPPADAVSSIAAERQAEPQAGKVVPPGGNVPADRQQLTAAVSALKDHVQNIRRGLAFTVDEEIDQVVVKVYDAETKEVIRQIPAEEVLNLARHLARSDGLLLKAKA